MKDNLNQSQAINVPQLRDMYDADGLGDACDPCTSPAAFVKPKLAIGKLLAPAGDETFALSGTTTVPTPPAIDPATHGLRVLVTASGGTSILDVTIPGGANWVGKPTSWTYKNKLGFKGITKVAIKTTTKVPGLPKISVKGAHAMLAAAPTDLPLTATVVIDVPLAMAGQCAAQTFTGPKPVPACAFDKKLRTVRCK